MAKIRNIKIDKLHYINTQNLFAKGQYYKLIDFLQSLTLKYIKNLLFY